MAAVSRSFRGYRTTLAVLGAALSLPANAAEPSFDCSNPASGAEEAVCGSDALAAFDVELDRLYRAAVDGPHMTPERLDELKATQRGWIKGRDDCWKASVGLEACIQADYAQRIYELRQGYSDARADEGASNGPFPWVCSGMDVPVSSVFIDGPQPVVTLQFGDNWLVLPQVRSGSGARYATDAPQAASFWTKGDEAMFVAPGAAETDCRLDSMN